MHNIVLLLLGFASVTICRSQAETSFWPFGNGAGIEFSDGNAVPIQPAGATLEASTSASDNEGNLLFYATSSIGAGGYACFNANQELMPNGTGIFCGTSCTSGALTIPRPGNPNEHYLFTIGPGQEIADLYYSVIDMTLDGGLGDVTETKNELLLELCTEKLTAVLHGNCTDYWLLGHQAGSADFYAWQVTSDGILPPVISAVGSVLGTPGTGFPSNYETGGQMKFSPDGSKVAHNIPGLQAVELFDFDNLTGIVSNPNQSVPAGPTGLFAIESEGFFDAPGLSLYGLEWSPNSRYLYVSEYTNNRIRQFDTAADDIWQSVQEIHGTLQGGEFGIFSNVGQVQGLQLGPDGKIYAARLYASFLSAIENPNSPGIGCNFTDTAITWFEAFDEGIVCDFGLPAFPTSYFNQPADFSLASSDFEGCAGEAFQFQYNGIAVPDSILWEFGDPFSDGQNTSTDVNPIHLFAEPGQYEVVLQVWQNCTLDSAEYVVTIGEAVQVDLEDGPIIVCPNEPVVLDGFTAGAENYLWSTGQTTPVIEVTEAGWFTLEAYSTPACASTDSVQVIIDNLNDPTIQGGDVQLCVDDPPLQFSTASDGGEWAGDGVTAAGTFDPSVGEGVYQVSYSFPDESCPTSDSIQLTVWPLPVVDFLADTLFGCAPLEVNFIGDGPGVGATWNWNFGDGSTQENVGSVAFHAYTEEGVFDVSVTVVSQAGCSTTIEYPDLIEVFPDPSAGFTADPWTDEAGGLSVDFTDQSSIADSWLWDFGDGNFSEAQNAAHAYASGGSYLVELTVSTEDGCTSTASLLLDLEIEAPVYVPNAFTPNGDGINETFQAYGTNVDEFEMQVYNRWGEMIFQSKDINIPWTGNVKGGEHYAPNGLYPWKITYRSATETTSLAGHVSLLR